MRINLPLSSPHQQEIADTWYRYAVVRQFLVNAQHVNVRATNAAPATRRKQAGAWLRDDNFRIIFYFTGDAGR